MSAVIWCGIVAVWAFILIPTWVRRGDHHWHRPLAGVPAAARVRQRIARGPREPADGVTARPSRSVGAMRRVRASAASAAARTRSVAPDADRAVAGAVRRPSRTVPVRRARRLAVLLALVVITGVAALLDPGRVLVVHLLVDAVTIGYVIHLRKVALERRRELARARRALAARRRWERSTADERARGIQGWPAAPAAPAETGHLPAAADDDATGGDPLSASAPRPAQPVYERMRRRRAATAAAAAAAVPPAMIDLTEPGTPLTLDLSAAEAAEGDYADAADGAGLTIGEPTEELVVAKAV